LSNANKGAVGLILALELASLTNEVYDINEAILQWFNLVPNIEVHMLKSVNFVSEENGMHYAYPTEFL